MYPIPPRRAYRLVSSGRPVLWVLVGALSVASGSWAASALPAKTPTEPRALADEKGPIVTFVGTKHRSDGGLRLFAELTETVAVERAEDKNVVRYRLVGARVTLRNNKNPLLMREFADSPILSARLVPEGKDVVLMVVLRKPVPAEHRMFLLGGVPTLQIDYPAPQPRE